MDKKVIITIVIILVVGVSGLLGWYFLQEEPAREQINQISQQVSPTINTATITRPPANTVLIINGRFNPSIVTISIGDTIKWINNDDTTRRIASDPFPASTDLPGLVSEDLEKGGSYSYTFETAGEWGYHDGLNPIKKGRIIVE